MVLEPFSELTITSVENAGVNLYRSNVVMASSEPLRQFRFLVEVMQ